MTDSTKTIYHPRPWADSILFRSLHCREDSQDTKYENMQNEPNPASTNERQETRDKRRINMQNEPNFNLLIHSFTHSLINTVMQNEPNLKRQANIKNAKRTQFINLHASRHKTYVLESTESGAIYAKNITKFYEILQNNPKIYSQNSLFLINSYTLFLFFSSKMRTFSNFSSFFQLSYQNTLNSKYNKDLHNFLTLPNAQRATGHERRVTIYAKQTQFQSIGLL